MAPVWNRFKSRLVLCSDMTEDEMMDLALRLSEQEASDSALRRQEEDAAMMKAIKESVGRLFWAFLIFRPPREYMSRLQRASKCFLG